MSAIGKQSAPRYAWARWNGVEGQGRQAHYLTRQTRRLGRLVSATADIRTAAVFSSTHAATVWLDKMRAACAEDPRIDFYRLVDVDKCEAARASNQLRWFFGDAVACYYTVKQGESDKETTR